MRPSFPAAVFAVAALFAATGQAGAADVKVETSRQLYEPGDTVEITVTNSRAGAISVPGCASFVVEVFEADAYRPIVVEKCVSEGTALELEPGPHSLNFVADGGRSGQIVRVGLAFGWGCEKGKPLSQARCKDFETVYSSNFRIGRAND